MRALPFYIICSVVNKDLKFVTVHRRDPRDRKGSVILRVLRVLCGENETAKVLNESADFYYIGSRLCSIKGIP